VLHYELSFDDARHRDAASTNRRVISGEVTVAGVTTDKSTVETARDAGVWDVHDIKLAEEKNEEAMSLLSAGHVQEAVQIKEQIIQSLSEMPVEQRSAYRKAMLRRHADSQRYAESQDNSLDSKLKYFHFEKTLNAEASFVNDDL